MSSPTYPGMDNFAPSTFSSPSTVRGRTTPRSAKSFAAPRRAYQANCMTRLLTLSFFGAVACGGLAPGRAAAATFTYTGNSCGFFGCGFNNPANWSPAGGPPGTDDTATIEMNDFIFLSANTQAINTLNIRNGATVNTLSNVLNVTGGANGFTEVVGAKLVVQGDAFLFNFATDSLSLRQAGELAIQDSSVLATFVIRVSTTSVISGSGTVGLTAAAGTSLDMAGTIRPEGGDLTFVAPNSLFDLDGNSAGADLGGVLDVTADGDLIFTGALADPFSGRLDIGNDNRVQFSTPLVFNGELNFLSNLINRLVAPTITFQSGAQITVQTADGRLEADTIFNSGVQTTLVNAADDLRLMGDSTIHNGAVFSGLGSLLISGGGTMTLRDGANVGVRILNTGAGELRIGQSAGAATVAAYVQDPPSSLEIELGGLVPGDDFDQLTIAGAATLAGFLDVSLIGGFTLAAGDSFEILDVGGVRTGQFTGLPEGALVGAFAEDLFITYNGGDGNDVVLFTAGFSADFDDDNDVDGADFLIWQRHAGLQGGATKSDGDADGNADVDGDDLLAWKNQFGSVAATASTAATPEPTSALLLLCGGATVVCLRRRTLSRRWPTKLSLAKARRRKVNTQRKTESLASSFAP